MDFPSEDVIIFKKVLITVFDKKKNCFDSWKTQVELCNLVTSKYYSAQLLVHMLFIIFITSMWQQKCYQGRFYFWFQDVIIFPIRALLHVNV